MGSVNVEREIDRLYGLPLDEFTSARNELAKKLTKAGDREAGAGVKALRKPTVPAWTVNQLQRKDETGMRRLLRAADKLTEAQTGAVSGKRSPNLRALIEEHQQAAQALVAEANQALGDVDADALRRIGPVLLTASVDAEAREVLAAGRLVREPEATGFGAVAGIPVTAPEPEPEPKPKGPSKAEEARRERLEAARKELADLERQAKAAGRAAKAADRAAETARKRVERLQGD